MKRCETEPFPRVENSGPESAPRCFIWFDPVIITPPTPGTPPRAKPTGISKIKESEPTSKHETIYTLTHEILQGRRQGELLGWRQTKQYHIKTKIPTVLKNQLQIWGCIQQQGQYQWLLKMIDAKKSQPRSHIPHKTLRADPIPTRQGHLVHC